MKRTAITALLLAACASTEAVGPDWGRPLPYGAPALIPLGPDEPWPDVAPEFERREAILPALERSLEWTRKPSARSHFPQADVTYERALASLERFRDHLAGARSAEDFLQRLEQEFVVYKSAGWDGEGGGVLYTGYYTPILDGRLEQGGEYRWPLYALPPDLEKTKEGEILGRRTADGLSPYPDRRTLETTRQLEGQGLEVAWLKSRLDAYIAHVNGSAVVKLADGSLFRLGYAGNNGHEYVSLRAELVADGKLDESTANLSSIRGWAESASEVEIRSYLERNPRYVFFTPISGNPRGCLNVEVTAERSLATDKSLFPRGALVFVDTEIPSGRSRGGKSFHQFMFDQDAGGAIRTAGRADIYLGIGPKAERLAGSTQVPGQLYYFFLDEALDPQRQPVADG